MYAAGHASHNNDELLNRDDSFLSQFILVKIIRWFLMNEGRKEPRWGKQTDLMVGIEARLGEGVQALRGHHACHSPHWRRH